MNDFIQINEIVQLTEAELVGDALLKVLHLATDSRSLPRSGQVMFVAISGEHHNGNDYLEDVYEKGVRIFLVDRRPHIIHPDATYCIVKNSMQALQSIVIYRRKAYTGTVIAVTGSNGKTIVKEWLYQLLQKHTTVVRSPRSYNSQLGVPLSVWQLSDKYEYAIIEAGISMPEEMAKLEKIISPKIGVFTNLGTAHSENFISDSQKLKEKLTLFTGCKKLIYNSDIQIDGIFIGDFITDKNIERISWSLGNEQAKYTYRLSSGQDGSVGLKIMLGAKEFTFVLPYSDGASIENLLNVITTLLELKLDPDSIARGLKNIEPVAMRLETLNGIHGSMLVNDVYNSDLAGLGVALDVLEQQTGYEKKLVILSDVFQSGMKGEALYAEVATLLHFRDIDKLFLIGNAIGEHRDFFPESATFYDDTASFLTNFNPATIANAAVLIKGARKFTFENITHLLQLQFHTTVLEINLTALSKNLNYYRSIISPGTKIMVMVKALSYGSGGPEIAGFLQHEKVDYLAVAFPDEGLQLRKGGVNLPIMVMNADLNDYSTLLEYDLEPEIYSFEGLEAYVRQCKYLGQATHPIHLKLDTGMHRLGFEEKEVDLICETLSREELKVSSILTHLAASDDSHFDDFTREQINCFSRMAKKIKRVAGEEVLLHALNSAGTERFPEYNFDMVRIGIGLYGHGISKNLVPLSTFKTAISQIRDVKRGDSIGYGRSGKVTRDSKIATIPVGYADGIDRRLGNGNYSFFLNGSKVPTIGNICMDMTMIDISGVEAKQGDSVELFGNICTLEEMAQKLDTIVYEVLTSVPERVKRVYIRE